MTPVVLAMGVCGSGKTEVGRLLAARQGHFMPATLLDSQLATLEWPAAEEHAIIVDVAATPDALVGRIMGMITAKL